MSLRSAVFPFFSLIRGYRFVENLIYPLVFHVCPGIFTFIFLSIYFFYGNQINRHCSLGLFYSWVVSGFLSRIRPSQTIFRLKLFMISFGEIIFCMMLVPLLLVLWDDENQLYNRDNNGVNLTIVGWYDQFEILLENKRQFDRDSKERTMNKLWGRDERRRMVSPLGKMVGGAWSHH